MIGVCKERRRSQNEAVKGHFSFGIRKWKAARRRGAFFYVLNSIPYQKEPASAGSKQVKHMA